LHEQFVLVTDLGTDDEKLGQEMQVVTPDTSEYVPAVQSVQFSDLADENCPNLPTSHFTQVDPTRMEPGPQPQRDVSSNK
jgi:hypothetical protein